MLNNLPKNSIIPFGVGYFREIISKNITANDIVVSRLIFNVFNALAVNIDPDTMPGVIGDKFMQPYIICDFFTDKWNVICTANMNDFTVFNKAGY